MLRVKRWSHPASIAFSLLFIAIMCFTLLPLPVQIPFGGAGVARADSPLTIYPTYDNYLSGDSPTTNYGTATNLVTYSYNNIVFATTLLQFDLSGIPAGATITAATLSLYYYAYYSTYNPSGHTITLNRLRRANWEETDSDWQHYDASGANHWTTVGASDTTNDIDTSLTASTTVPGAVNAWMDWNVKTLVEDGIANRSNILRVRAHETSAAAGFWVEYYYSNNNATLKPKLVIAYTPPPPTIATLAATSITSTSATLNGNVTSLGAGGNVTNVAFVWDTSSHVAPTSAPNGLWANGNLSTTVNYEVGQAFSYAIPAGLPVNTLYYFMAGGNNTSGWDWGSVGNFTTSTVPQEQEITILGSGSVAGTISVANGNATVVGSGTVFTEWLAGDQIYLPDLTWGNVSSVTGNTSLELTAVYAGSTLSGQTYDMRHINYPLRFDLMSNYSVLGINQHMTIGATNGGVVLSPGGEGTWDSMGTGLTGVVVMPDGTFQMYYYGYDSFDVPNGQAPWAVGLATSPDITNGGNWTKTTSGIGGTSKILAPAPGWYGMYPSDIYTVGATNYLWAMYGTDTTWATFQDFPLTLYSSTSSGLPPWTLQGFLTDTQDMGIASSIASNFELLQDSVTHSPLLENGYYYASFCDNNSPARINLARSTTLDPTSESYPTGDDAVASVYGNNTLAQTFSASSAYKLTAVLLKVNKYGSPTGSMTVALKAVDGSSKPTGGNLASQVLDTSTLTTSSQWILFRLFTNGLPTGSSYTVVNGTKYAVVVSYPTGTASNYVEIGYDSTSASYSGGGIETSTDNGSTWTSESATTDLIFKIDKSIWTNMGTALTPASYSTNNTFLANMIGGRIFKFGNQYCLTVGSEDIYTYFAYSNDITDIDSWTLCKDPWWVGQAPYSLFYAHFAIYPEGTAINCWQDMGSPGTVYDAHVIYFTNDPTRVVTLEGYAQASFADIRWKDSTKTVSLAYFIEDSVQDSVSGWASVWVNVPIIPSNGSDISIYLQWGNQTLVDAQNPAGVFTFFDHFDDSSYTTNWTLTAGTASESGTLLTIGGSSNVNQVVSKVSYGSGYAFMSRVARGGITGRSFPIVMGKDGDNYKAIYGYILTTSTLFRFLNFVGGEGSLLQYSIETKIRNDITYRVFEIGRNLAGVGTYSIDDRVEITSDTAITGNTSIYLEITEAATADREYVDWVAVRKYTSPEPQAAVRANISNTPASHGFGVVQPSQTIYSKTGLTPPSFPLADGNCTGNVTNLSSFTLDYLTVVITDFSGGTAINIVSTAPGTNEVRVMIFESGAGNDTDGIYLTNAAQNWVADVAASEEVYWELKLETGSRNTFGYGVYTATLTFTTEPAGDSETVTITFTWGDRRRGIGIAPCMFY